MKLRSLLYASNSMLNPATADQDVRKIVAAAATRNRANGITGALLFTGDHFTQILEGSPDRIEAIFRIICAHPAHTNIVVLEDVEIAARRFNDWNIEYAGPSLFVARKIERALSQAQGGSVPDVARLVSLIQAFAKAN